MSRRVVPPPPIPTGETRLCDFLLTARPEKVREACVDELVRRYRVDARVAECALVARIAVLDRLDRERGG